MRIVALILMLCSAAWSFLPVFIQLMSTWDSHADYSHGYLVIPISIWLLFFRRSLIPNDPQARPIIGALIAIAGLAMPFIGELIYIRPLGAWGIPVFCLGTTIMFLGFNGLRWTWPATLFLLFMIPLPFRMETALSLPLQSIATNASCWVLQLLGQPAFSEGHTIWLNERALEVEQACSGLRIFIAIVALGFVYIVTTETAWWEKIMIAVGIIPISLIANVTRIVVTGLLYELANSQVAEKFSHDFAGFAMIPFAALLFAGMIWYIKRLFPEVEVIDIRTAAASA